MSYGKWDRTESIEFGIGIAKSFDILRGMNYRTAKSDIRSVIEVLETLINGYNASKSGRLSFDEVRDSEKYKVLETHKSFFKDIGVNPEEFINVVKGSKRILESILVEDSVGEIERAVRKSEISKCGVYLSKMSGIFSTPFDNGIRYSKSKNGSKY